MEPAPTKVFISYSHDSPAHERRILELSERLRAEGVDCQIDQYDPSPPEGWSRWMARQVREADFVILVCTENSYRRFTGQEIPGRGLGAQWEGALITQELYEQAAKNTKFIPILYSEEDAAFIPEVLRSYTHYRLDAEDGYEDLYRRLTVQPRITKAPLGSLRILEPTNPSARPTTIEPRAKPKQASPEISLAELVNGPSPEYVLIYVNDKRFAFIPSARIEQSEVLELDLVPDDQRKVAFLADLKSNQFAPEVAVVYRNTAMQGSLNGITSIHERGEEHWKVRVRPSKDSFYSPLRDFSLNGYSADDLGELRARLILLNEKYAPTRGRRNMEDTFVEAMIVGNEGLVKQIKSPIPHLFEEYGTDKDFFLKAARLMCVLYLKLTGTVDHIFALDLRLTAGSDGVEVNFEGQRPAQYQNAPEQIIKLEGICPLR